MNEATGEEASSSLNNEPHHGATAAETIQVRIGGVTYHFARMTEAMWAERQRSSGAKGSQQQPPSSSSSSVPQPLAAADSTAVTAPLKEVEKAAVAAANTERQRSSTTAPASNTAAAVGGEQKEKAPKELVSNDIPSPTNAASPTLPLSGSDATDGHKGPKFAPTDDATMKQKRVAKMSAHAVSRRKVLRLSRIESCRLGLGLRGGKGGRGGGDDESVLISAVEFTSGGGGGGSRARAPSASGSAQQQRSASSSAANRRALLNAADAGASKKPRATMGGKSAADASAPSSVMLNGQRGVRPADEALFAVGRQTEAILGDLCEYIMNAEERALRSRGRPLRDDEMDELIAGYRRATAAREEKERAAKEKKEAEERAAAEEEEAEEDDVPQPSFGFDFYVLTHEEPSSSAAATDSIYGAGGGFGEDGDEGEEEAFDGYDLIDGFSEGDGDGDNEDAADDDETTREIAAAKSALQYNTDVVANTSSAAASSVLNLTDEAVYHDGELYVGAGEEEDDEAGRMAAEHLAYDFASLTLGPHAAEARARWRSQPMDVAISGGGNSAAFSASTAAAGGAGAASYLSAPNNTTDDDFDFTEVARGPAPSATYSLQAPTLSGTAVTADGSEQKKKNAIDGSTNAKSVGGRRHVTFADDDDEANDAVAATASTRAGKGLAAVAAGHFRDFFRQSNTFSNVSAANDDASATTSASFSAVTDRPALHADPFANMRALNEWLEHEEAEAANGLVPDGPIATDANGGAMGTPSSSQYPSNALIMRSFFGPLLGQLRGTSEGDIHRDATADGSAPSAANLRLLRGNGNGSGPSAGTAAASASAVTISARHQRPHLPSNSRHLRSNLGGEDPEVVFQHDDAYDSNDEDHYGNDYADESDGSDSNSDNDDDDDDDSNYDSDDHDDDRAGMGFGVGSSNNKQCRSGGRCPITDGVMGRADGGGNGGGIFDFDEDDTDSEDDEFQGYDRYGDLGHHRPSSSGGLRCVGFGPEAADDGDSDDYGDDSGDECYEGERRRTQVPAKWGGGGGDDFGGFDDYGRVAHDECDDVDNYY